MPFVDINSISPKKQQDDQNTDDLKDVQEIEMDSGVKEIKGPPLGNNETVNFTASTSESISAAEQEQQVPSDLPQIPFVNQQASQQLQPKPVETAAQVTNPSANVEMNEGKRNSEMLADDGFAIGIGKSDDNQKEQPTDVNQNVDQTIHNNGDSHVASGHVTSEPTLTNQTSPQIQEEMQDSQSSIINQKPSAPTVTEVNDMNNQQGQLANLSVGKDFTAEVDLPSTDSTNEQDNIIEENEPVLIKADENDISVNEEPEGLSTQSLHKIEKQQIESTQQQSPSEHIASKVEKMGKIDHSLDDYLTKAIELNASDLHISAGYRAFVRVNGAMTPLPSKVLNKEDTRQYAMQMFDYKGLSKNQKLKTMDFDMAYELKSGHRFRVNIYKQKDGYALVFRLIQSRIRSLDDLGMPSVLLEFAKKPYGLVLVTGPTGSGKSTTLAALLNYINMTSAKHIITIEDPIEYVYPVGKAKVDQRELIQDTESWDIALRSALRQDPDVVLVGEMRDYETIASAIRIAETGHLVFATLHTNTAAQTIDRIIDVFPDTQQSQIRIQLASTLQAVITQRLVPNNTGKGRIAATEILVATDAVRASIRENKVHQINNIIQTSADVGMMTIEQSLVNLVRQGLISTEVAQEYTSRPEEVLALLSRT